MPDNVEDRVFFWPLLPTHPQEKIQGKHSNNLMFLQNYDKQLIFVMWGVLCMLIVWIAVMLLTK